MTMNPVSVREDWGIIPEIILCSFLWVVLITQTTGVGLYGNYGVIGDVVFFIGVFGMFAFAISLAFFPSAQDFLALGYGFVFAILAIAIIIPEANPFSSFITYNALILVGWWI